MFDTSVWVDYVPNTMELATILGLRTLWNSKFHHKQIIEYLLDSVSNK